MRTDFGLYVSVILPWKKGEQLYTIFPGPSGNALMSRIGTLPLKLKEFLNTSAF
ncbi:hypothetical protein J6590_058526 [Homalodisca vitripennis]|nr:hypothetical protein J6590_058526 [Homalodisca vitripennis]